MIPESDAPGGPAGSAAGPGFGAYNYARRRPNSPKTGETDPDSALSSAQPAGGYARAQSDLVAALTGTGPTPPGFDPVRVDVARQALLRKRAGEVAKIWPLLRASMPGGPGGFESEFARWATQRPTVGPFRDGWDFAEYLAARSALPEQAFDELTGRRLVWRYDGTGAATRRRLPRIAVVGGRLIIQLGGRVRTLGRSPEPGLGFRAYRSSRKRL